MMFIKMELESITLNNIANFQKTKKVQTNCLELFCG